MTILPRAPFAAQIIDAGGALFNVRHPDFGAKADGIADDANAILRATRAAADQGGGTVLLPAGTYRVGAPLVLDRPNVFLLGVGGYDRTEGALRAATTLLFDLRRAAPAVQISAKHLGIQDLALTTVAGSRSGTGVLIDNGERGKTIYRVLIRGVSVRGFDGPGILAVEPEEILIDDCLAIATGGSGIELRGSNGVGINNTINRTRVFGAGAASGIRLSRVLVSTLANVQVLDGAARSSAILVEDCSETTLLGCDVERPASASGIVIHRGTTVTLVNCFGNVLSRFVALNGDASNYLRNVVITGCRATSSVQVGLNVGEFVEGVSVLQARMNAVQPFSVAAQARGIHLSDGRDQWLPLQLDSNDESPNVRAGKIFRTNNSRPTTIGGFDEGSEGQEIVVCAEDSFTTVENNRFIQTRTGVSQVLIAGLTYRFTLVAGRWREHG